MSPVTKSGSKGAAPGSEWDWLGPVIGVIAIFALVGAAVLNVVGVTPGETVAWVKAAPQHVVDAAGWVGEKVAGTRCALHPCDDAPAAAPTVGTRPVAAEGPYKVTKVTDGDTIHVTIGGKNVTIRIIGIDTPETHDPRKPVQCYGPEASAQAGRLLGGKSVYLEYDDTQGRTDKYGRTLAYVWYGAHELYELTVLTGGYAHEYTYAKAYHRQAQFRAAQAAAKATKAGFWAATTCNGNTTQPEPARSAP